MREIKFRAWDTLTKKMISEGFYVIGETTMFNMIDQYIHEHKGDAESSLQRFNDIELMQYTGLKDKNGKDIYPHDVIRWEGGFHNGAFIGEVLLEEGTVGPCKGPNVFGYYLKGRKENETNSLLNGSGLYNLWKLEQMEVIGNIYENPELL
jgi:uncharacterized phage protein (TIGR01671 family)